jgi:phosphoribosylaminoimidazole-succinocarboxamide synthase
MLKKNGIPTHLVKLMDDNHQLVKSVEIVPLEVIIAETFARQVR